MNVAATKSLYFWFKKACKAPSAAKMVSNILVQIPSSVFLRTTVLMMGLKTL